MPVGSITQVFSQYAQQVTGNASGGASGAASARAEANETVADTKREAAKGDRVAKAKLAREQQSQVSPAVASAAQAGKGALLNTSV